MIRHTLCRATDYLKALGKIENEYPDFEIIKIKVIDSKSSFDKLVRTVIEVEIL